MIQKVRTLDRLYVASPCSADWNAMPGDDQVRFCDQCRLNVYNISAMTRKHAEQLIARTEGQLCTKLYRRADGTIITRDCPFGIRAIKLRASRMAGAAFSAILSLLTSQTIVWADHNNCAHYRTKVIKLQSEDDSASIQGTVYYMKDEVLAEAAVTLGNEKTKRRYILKTNDKGRFDFSTLPSGKYVISIEFPGFATFTKKNITAKAGKSLQLDVMMQVGTTGGAALLPTQE